MQLDKPRLTMAPKEFGAFIREKRLERGFTQSTVANFLGVTKGAVSHWEQGRVEGIDPINLFRLASLLEFGEEHINQLFPDRFVDLVKAPSFDQEADAVKVMKVYATLPSPIRQAIKAMILNTAAVLENEGKSTGRSSEPVQWEEELPSVFEVEDGSPRVGLFDEPPDTTRDVELSDATVVTPTVVTRCPTCHRIFSVPSEILGHGLVRCGGCRTDFDPGSVKHSAVKKEKSRQQVKPALQSLSSHKRRA